MTIKSYPPFFLPLKNDRQNRTQSKNAVNNV